MLFLVNRLWNSQIFPCLNNTRLAKIVYLFLSNAVRFNVDPIIALASFFRPGWPVTLFLAERG